MKNSNGNIFIRMYGRYGTKTILNSLNPTSGFKFQTGSSDYLD